MSGRKRRDVSANTPTSVRVRAHSGSLSLSLSFLAFHHSASGRPNKPLMRNGCYSCPPRYFCAITIYHICLFSASVVVVVVVLRPGPFFLSFSYSFSRSLTYVSFYGRLPLFSSRADRKLSFLFFPTIFLFFFLSLSS